MPSQIEGLTHNGLYVGNALRGKCKLLLGLGKFTGYPILFDFELIDWDGIGVERFKEFLPLGAELVGPHTLAAKFPRSVGLHPGECRGQRAAHITLLLFG